MQARTNDSLSPSFTVSATHKETNTPRALVFTVLHCSVVREELRIRFVGNYYPNFVKWLQTFRVRYKIYWRSSEAKGATHAIASWSDDSLGKKKKTLDGRYRARSESPRRRTRNHDIKWNKFPCGRNELKKSCWSLSLSFALANGYVRLRSRRPGRRKIRQTVQDPRVRSSGPLPSPFRPPTWTEREKKSSTRHKLEGKRKIDPINSVW